jgi:hypothetical protein
MPLSRDPDARRRQVENLHPCAGAAAPGNTRRVTHGLRSAAPLRLLDAKEVGDVAEALAAVMPTAQGGSVDPGDLVRVELAATLWLQVRLAGRHMAAAGDTKMQLAALELWSRAVTRLGRELDALGIGPAARARLGVDVARIADLATAMSEPDPERRRVLLREAGLDEEEEPGG